MSIGTSRRGESSKNSASVPLRSGLHAHSCAETTTAFGSPCRVMICGLVCARSMRREKCAFALVNVQVFDSAERLLKVMRAFFDEPGYDRTSNGRPGLNNIPIFAILVETEICHGYCYAQRERIPGPGR